MGEYDWLDLSQREHQTYLLNEANYLHEEAKKIPSLEETISNQEIYIKHIEKQLRLLQKTLDAIAKIQRGGRLKVYGRKKNVCKNNYR